MIKAKAFAAEMESLGFPPQYGSSVNAPFDYIGDYLRGTKGAMLDMYRNPDKLLQCCEKLVPIMTERE